MGERGRERKREREKERDKKEKCITVSGEIMKEEKRSIKIEKMKGNRIIKGDKDTWKELESQKE